MDQCWKVLSITCSRSCIVPFKTGRISLNIFIPETFRSPILQSLAPLWTCEMTGCGHVDPSKQTRIIMCKGNTAITS